MADQDQAWAKAAGVKGLSEDGACVPSKFIRPLHWRVKEEELSSVVDGVPLIDFSQPDEDIVQEVANATRDWGFFQVDNHGVAGELLDSMLEVAHHFFDMPPEEKMVHYSEDFDSYVRYGTSYDVTKETHFDWHDHLQHRFPSLEEAHPWPVKPASYGRTAERYLQQVTVFAKRVSALISKGLGVDPEYLYEAMRGPQVLMRLNYYPPCKNSELVLGQTPHCDYGTFTILLQDNVEGLQVLHDGHWRTVKPRRGTLVVNVGDQLELWSNQKFRSVKHRVAIHPRETRLSIATFFLPNDNALVSPISELIDEQHPPLYEGCVFKNFLAKTGTYRVLDTLKIQK